MFTDSQNVQLKKSVYAVKLNLSTKLGGSLSTHVDVGESFPGAVIISLCRAEICVSCDVIAVITHDGRSACDAALTDNVIAHNNDVIA